MCLMRELSLYFCPADMQSYDKMIRLAHSSFRPMFLQ